MGGSWADKWAQHGCCTEESEPHSRSYGKAEGQCEKRSDMTIFAFQKEHSGSSGVNRRGLTAEGQTGGQGPVRWLLVSCWRELRSAAKAVEMGGGT